MSGAERPEDGPAIGAGRPSRLEDVFDGLCAGEPRPGAAMGREPLSDSVTVGEVMSALAHRSYGPLLLLPALISILPVIGALPGVTWTMSALSLLISLHFLFNRRSLWLPGGVKTIRIPREALQRAVDWAKPGLRLLDRFVHPRFNLMLAPPWPVLIAILCVLLSLAMFVTSIVPGGVVIPALGVVLLAIGLTTHDGLVLLLGLTAAVGAGWGAYAIFF